MMPTYSPALKAPIRFSRTFAIIWVLIMSTAGAKALFFSSASTNSGSIKITSYVFINGVQTPIGNVNIAVEAVGGPQSCTSNTGTTNASGDNSVTLTGCQVANNGSAKMYRLTTADRAGYAFRSLHSNHGPGRPIEAGNSFKVVKGDTTSLQVWMEDLTPPAPAPPTPAPAPAPPTPSPTVSSATGKLRIITYEYENGDFTKPKRRGNIKISLQSVPAPSGATFSCERMEAESISEPTRPREHDEYATVLLNSCQVSESTGKKQYQISGSHPEYDLASIRDIDAGGSSWPVLPDGKFDIDKDKIRSVAVFMKPKSVASTPVQPLATPSSPAPAGQKNGKIRIISYDYNGGSKIRQGNVTVHVKASGSQYQISDVSRNCDEYNKTTDTNGSDNPSSNYAKAHFNRCWTSSDGSKTYEISYLSIPANYSFRSFRITSGGTFHGTGESVASTTAGKQFVVKDNEETQLEIWMDKSAPLPVISQSVSTDDAVTESDSQAPQDTKPPAVRQVITQSGVRFVAGGKEREVSKELAVQLNAIPAPVRKDNPNVTLLELMRLALDSGHTNPNFELLTSGSGSSVVAKTSIATDCNPETNEDEDGDPLMCPALPPSPPGNVTAIQDDAGNIQITWQASSVPPIAGDVTYDVYRTNGGTKVIIESCEDTEATLPTNADPNNPTDPSNGLNCEDDGTTTNGVSGGPEFPLAYPSTYTYEVYAKTGDDDERAIGISTPGLVQITTTPLTPDVIAELSSDGATEEETEEEVDSTEDDDPEELVDEEADLDKEEVPKVIIKAQESGAVVSIPVSAHKKNMACALNEYSDDYDDMLDEYGDAEKVYGLTCREEDGDMVDQFDEEVEYEFEFDESEFDEDDGLYAFDGVDWEEVSTDGTKSKGRVKYASAKRVKGDKTTKFTMRSKSPLRLAIMGNNDDRRIPLIVYVAVPLAVSAVAGALIVSRRQQRNAMKVAYMSDVDLQPLPSSEPVIHTPETMDKKDE